MVKIHWQCCLSFILLVVKEGGGSLNLFETGGLTEDTKNPTPKDVQAQDENMQACGDVVLQRFERLV